MHQARLIKGKTYQIDGIIFDIKDENLHTRIVSDEIADKLKATGKFAIDGDIKIDILKEIEILTNSSYKLKGKEDGIAFITHHVSNSEGYGCLANELVSEYPTVIGEIRDDITIKNEDRFNLSDIPKSSVIIQLFAADLFRNRKLEFEKSVGYSMFETTQLPAHWAGIVNYTCDLLLVPAIDVGRVFEKSGVKIPIKVVPLWVNKTYKYFERPKRDIFTFLWSGKFDSFNRKGAVDTFEAFVDEFGDDDRVKLIIKTSKCSIPSELAKEIRSHKNVDLRFEILSRDKLYQLYKDVDCFVFPTHGEGFGLPPLEAMATGLPTIVTKWLGCKDFALEDVCYPIKVTELEDAFYPKIYGDVGKWAKINKKQVRKHMRYIFENQDKAFKVGKKAAQFVDDNYRLENFKENIRKAVGVKEKPVTDKVSVVIAIKDNLDYLKKSVKSVIKNTKVGYELIIVDNGSNKDVKQFLNELSEKYLQVKIITNKENKGYAYACNQGLKLAQYKFICMLDADTIVAPYWLTKMLREMNKRDNCGIIVPTQQAITMHYAKFKENKDLDIFDNVAEFAKTLKDGFEEKEIYELYGFCHLVRKEVYDQIGGYDWKRYYKVAANETDLFWRATQKGWTLGWAKGAYVHHFHNKIKQNLGYNPKQMVDKGHKIFEERRQSNEDIFVKNDAEVGY